MTAPLTQSQTGIFAECMQNPESNLYNLSYLLKISKKIDLERLREAILTTLEAHPYSYCRVKVNEEGNGEQYIDDSEGFQVDIEEVADIDAVKPHLLQTMRLDGGKLFYFKLLNAPEANYIYFQFHHIVFDGASLRILVRDIDNAYQGKKIEDEPVSSIDFALNEFEQRQGELWKNDQQWYREHFVCDDVDTVLQPDLEEKTFRSRTVQRDLQIDADAINRFCKQNKVSLDNFFTSAYALLMSRYTGDDQVLFSTIWHGRGDFHLARTFGMFVRTVPAFFSVNGDMTLDELFKQGPLTTEETRKHSLYSYADFCGEQGVETHQMFVYQGKLFRDMTLGGEPMTIEQLVNNMTNEPLEIQVFQTNDAFVISISSHAHRYSEVFVEQLIQSYETVLGQMMDLEKTLKEIQVVSDAQLKLLDQFNDTDSDYDDSQTIVSLFEKQAQLHAEKVAVVFKDKQFTYKELDEMSDRIAKLVASKGLGPRMWFPS